MKKRRENVTFFISIVIVFKSKIFLIIIYFSALGYPSFNKGGVITFVGKFC